MSEYVGYLLAFLAGMMTMYSALKPDADDVAEAEEYIKDLEEELYERSTQTD